MLTTGCAPPLGEDWCLRRMEWVGRRVFERGYWKSGDEKSKEVEVLDASEGDEVTDGIIEDEDDDDEGAASGNGSGSDTLKRWMRIVRCAVGIAHGADGFRWVEGTRDWRIEGVLERKVQKWKEEARIEQEAEEKRRRGTRRADNAMEVDEEIVDDSSEESEDDEDDSVEVKALKVNYLRTLLIIPLCRPAAGISGAWCNQQSVGLSHPRRHLPVAAGLVDLRKNLRVALL